MARKKSEDDIGAIGCAAIVVIGLILAAAKALIDFLGDHPVAFILILAVVGLGIGWWFYVRSEFERHAPAISILRLMSYPDSKIQKKNREIIDSYLHTIDHYNPAMKSLDTVLKENKTKASSLGDYLEQVHREFDADEKAILLDHASRIRDADRTRNELADKWHAQVLGSLQGRTTVTSRPSPPAAHRDETDILDMVYVHDELQPFNSAITEIVESSLPAPVRNLAGRLDEKVQVILDMDFNPDIEASLENLLCVDLPTLVDEWKDVDELSRGRAKEQADDAFVTGFRRLCRSFESLLERQAALTAGNVSTKSIYFESKHLLDEDDPFHEGEEDIDQILPSRSRP